MLFTGFLREGHSETVTYRYQCINNRYSSELVHTLVLYLMMRVEYILDNESPLLIGPRKLVLVTFLAVLESKLPKSIYQITYSGL